MKRPRTRQEIYSTIIMPINRILPIDKANMRYHKQSRTYSKFKPIACSTPKLQAPMFNILHRQSSSKPRRIDIGGGDKFDSRQEFSRTILDSKNCHTDTEPLEKPFNKKATDDPNNITTCSITSISDRRVDIPIEDAPFSNNGSILILPFPEQTRYEIAQTVDPALEKSNVDLFGTKNSCMHLQSRSGSREMDQQSEDIIPFVLITSYKDENASKDNTINDTPLQKPPNLITPTETPQSDFLGQIEDLIFDVIESLIRTNEIDPWILTSKSGHLLQR